jgi:AraC-like DNA-binding protein
MTVSNASEAYQIEQRKILRSYFQDIVDVISESGQAIDLDSQLAKLGLCRQDVELGSKNLGFSHYYQLLGTIDQTGLIPGFGLRLGAKKTVNCFGIYGYAMLSSPTYGHFNSVAKRLFRVIYDVLDLNAVVSHGQLIITYETLFKPRLGFVALMEQVLACGVALMTSLLPKHVSWDKCEIHFSHPKPDYLEIYAQYLPCKIRFNQALTQLIVPEEWMVIELASGDELMAEFCDHQFKRLIDGLTSSDSMADNTRRVLLNSRANNMPKLADVAEKFNMAERTLRHKLAHEQVSFRDLVLDVRISHAKRYLQETDFTIQEVAYLLGYAQIQNFYRAFGKIMGTTPETFRRKSYTN